MYKALIFDIGNVVIRIDTRKIFAAWGRALGLDPGRIERAVAFDDRFIAYEKGLIGTGEYEAHTASLLGVSFPDGAFEAGWNAIYAGAVPGVSGLLQRLKGRYRLVGLTNTNAAHSPVWLKKYSGELGSFEKIFQSFEIGARKPEPAAYHAVLAYLKADPSETVFLDDTPENVRAAERLGMAGTILTPGADLPAELKKLGIAV